jgi:hypothetical protein
MARSPSLTPSDERTYRNPENQADSWRGRDCEIARLFFNPRWGRERPRTQPPLSASRDGFRARLRASRAVDFACLASRKPGGERDARDATSCRCRSELLSYAARASKGADLPRFSRHGSLPASAGVGGEEGTRARRRTTSAQHGPLRIMLLGDSIDGRTTTDDRLTVSP